MGDYGAKAVKHGKMSPAPPRKKKKTTVKKSKPAAKRDKSSGKFVKK